MHRFLSGHKCNSICQELGLRNPFPYDPPRDDSSASCRYDELTDEEKMQNDGKKNYIIPAWESVKRGPGRESVRLGRQAQSPDELPSGNSEFVLGLMNISLFLSVSFLIGQLWYRP